MLQVIDNNEMKYIAVMDRYDYDDFTPNEKEEKELNEKYRERFLHRIK